MKRKDTNSIVTMLRLALLGMLAITTITACTTKKKDLVSKVESDAFVRRADYQGKLVHVYRAVLEADSDNAIGITPGMGDDFGIARVKITETHLVLERAFQPGGRDETQANVLTFPITKHFDIIQEENDFKEKTNKVVEDTSKPWAQREYMRVDWKNPGPKSNTFVASLGGESLSEEATVLEAFVRTGDGHVSFLVESSVAGGPAARFTPPFLFEQILPYKVKYRTHLMPVKQTDFKPVEYSLQDFAR
ncbi:MAG: hypothetical protein V4692_13705, partial [Bdellovibrionota bacterium]